MVFSEILLVSCITFNSSCFVSASDLKIQLQIITSQLDECMWYDQIPVKRKDGSQKEQLLVSCKGILSLRGILKSI